MTAPGNRPSLTRKLTRQLLLLGAAMIVLQFIVVVIDYVAEDDKMSVLMARHEATSIVAALAMANGEARVSLSRSAEERYRTFSNDYAFRVIGETGRVLVERNPNLFRSLPFDPTGLPHFLTMKRMVNGVLARVSVEEFETAQGRVWVAVAIRRDPAGLYRLVLLHETLSHVAEPMLPLLVLTLIVTIFTVRRGLRPLTEAATRASELTPNAAMLRISDEGMPAEVAELVGTINDSLERVQRAFASQREFLAIAAHELRTPLAILMLQLDKLSGDTAATLRRDVDHMSRLVNQLLMIARLEGSAPPVMERLNLAVVARNVIERMLPLVAEQQRSIAFEDQAPTAIMGNADLISDALRNLIENALRHAPAGTVIRVSAGPDRCLNVDDEGPGISSDAQAHIFERFYRTASSPGAGLGLFIVRRIAETLGGDVQASRSPHGGARFTLTFPAAPGESSVR